MSCRIVRTAGLFRVQTEATGNRRYRQVGVVETIEKCLDKLQTRCGISSLGSRLRLVFTSAEKK